ncbi:MAG: glutathione S-transferase [Planctomycetota bacterium]|jgi:glutathione S-transferase
MTTELILHELPPSPNNVKVRLALGFKGIDYTSKPIDMSVPRGDRADLLAISGQPRTPVLQHGEVVIFDSNGIIRYLEANVKREPSLFSADYAEFGEIEKWELLARTHVGAPIGAMFGMAMSGDVTPEGLAAANAGFHEVTGELEERLKEGDFLVGGRTTNADLAIAPMINLATLSDAFVATSELMVFFKANLHLGDDRERTRAWIERHMAYDR